MEVISNFEEFDKYNTYYGNDLGAVIDGDVTRFKVWSPCSYCVFINLYADGEGQNLIETLPMRRIENGVWYIEFTRNLDGCFYTYTYEYDMKRFEGIDVYAKACGVNGIRGAVVDLSTTNPEGWENHKRPALSSHTDAVIYETHIRDFSIDPSSGVSEQNRGKYLAFTEKGTKCKNSYTCLSHLKALGVTHVQLLPIYDFCTVDEAHPEKKQYNWGYDPKNFNCPEGSYSTDPYDPKCRIRELKQLIMALHEAGIGVIMDVVYNHTYHTEDSPFHLAQPYYYHRTKMGKFTNGSGCGNETASNHAMMQKFIVDSVLYWAREYKLDGFRFDLMGLIDIDTVNLIRDKLNDINPQILMYGEGWTGGESALNATKLSYKFNSYSFGRVGLFNDNLRDAVKGSTFDSYNKGYVSGNFYETTIVKRGLVGSVPHHQIDGYQEACWAYEPTQAINYVEAHDNLTLWDKLSISAKHDFSEPQCQDMDKLSAAIIFFSQGIPFIQLGQDFLRSKPKLLTDDEATDNEDNAFEWDSYNKPDFTNSIKWERKNTYKSIYNYYRSLIKFRRTHSLFRLSSKSEIERKISFPDSGDFNIIIERLSDENETLFLVINPYTEQRQVQIGGTFKIIFDKDGNEQYEQLYERFTAEPLSAVVLKKTN